MPFDLRLNLSIFPSPVEDPAEVKRGGGARKKQISAIDSEYPSQVLSGRCYELIICGIGFALLSEENDFLDRYLENIEEGKKDEAKTSMG